MAVYDASDAMSIVTDEATERVRVAVGALNEAMMAAARVGVGVVLKVEAVKWKKHLTTYHATAQFLKQEVFW